MLASPHLPVSDSFQCHSIQPFAQTSSEPQLSALKPLQQLKASRAFAHQSCGVKHCTFAKEASVRSQEEFWKAVGK